MVIRERQSENHGEITQEFQNLDLIIHFKSWKYHFFRFINNYIINLIGEKYKEFSI